MIWHVFAWVVAIDVICLGLLLGILAMDRYQYGDEYDDYCAAADWEIEWVELNGRAAPSPNRALGDLGRDTPVEPHRLEL